MCWQLEITKCNIRSATILPTDHHLTEPKSMDLQLVYTDYIQLYIGITVAVMMATKKSTSADTKNCLVQ